MSECHGARPLQRPLPWLFLALGVFLLYGGRIAQLGFYHDDWILLSFFRSAGGSFSSQLKFLLEAQPTHLYRPLDPLLWTAGYHFFGLNPLPWQTTLLLINLLLGYAVYLLFQRYRLSPALAALAALLYLAYPNKDAALYWPMALVNSFSLGAFLWAYVLHLDFVARGGKVRLWASCALFLASLAAYDQCLLMLPIWLLLPDAIQDDLRRKRLLQSLAAAVLALSVFGLYKFALLPWLGFEYNKRFVFSASRFATVYLAGLNASLGPGLIRYVLSQAFSAFQEAPIAAALSALLPWLVNFLDGSENLRQPEKALGRLGAALFLLGYLPLAVSDYTPNPFNHENRLNQVPCLGLVAAACGLWLRRDCLKSAKSAACVLAGLFLAAHVSFAKHWAESYKRQISILETVRRELPSWPQGAILLIRMPERYVAGKAPVFDAAWDISGAIRLRTGEASRRADVVSPRLSYGPGGVVLDSGLRLPYSSLRLLDVERGRVEPVGYQDLRRMPPPL